MTDPMFTLAQALVWLPGGRLVGDPASAVARVHTDTRSLQQGDLFVALKGERYDANAYVADAWAAGAAAVLAHRGCIPQGVSGIEVDDTRLALGHLASGWRKQFTLPLIAVTGSNGKTTVTQMIASILRAWRGDAALATQGNFNNDIGVPLTLLRLRASHRVAVVELGMNHPGEIAYLAQLCQPSVALINNAQREHLEFMDTVQAVAHENGSVLASLDANGIAVFPSGDAHASVWRGLAGDRPVLEFGEAPPARVQLVSAAWTDTTWTVQAQTPAGAVGFTLPVAGRHNVLNALAATACALSAGAPLQAIAAGLSTFQPVKGRSRAFTVSVAGRPLTAVDDTYNANPDSVRAAIAVLAALPGPHLLVLGDMGEVGDQGPQFHAEVGEHARASGIAQLFTLGEQSKAMGGTHFTDAQALIAAVTAVLPHVGSVLVKGSRFMKMERVIEAIAQTDLPPDIAKEAAHAA